MIRNITLKESEPVITDLWVRNGDGKTTLMKLLAGHERPDSGNLRIMGEEAYNNRKAVRKICYMQEDQPFSQLWTVEEVLQLARYYSPNWDQLTARRLLRIFELDQRKKLYETLLQSHAENPRLIMISTHHIEELQLLFETLAVLHHGRLLFYRFLEEVWESGIWLAGAKAVKVT